MRTPLALLMFVSAACGSRTARFETADVHEKTLQRRPPAIAIDPISELPSPATRGSTEATLVVLSAPRELSAIRETVQRFFRAVVSETPADLDALLADQAWLDASSGRLPARNAFRSRFAQLDFSGLRGVMLYRERDMQVYRASDARALSTARTVPDDLRADEVFVRVPLAVSHAGKLRLFSDEVTLTLRADLGGFLIHRITENTPVP